MLPIPIIVSTDLCAIVFCQFIESDHPEIGGVSRVVEEPYHPVDGGEGDDVEQNHHIACNKSFIINGIAFLMEFVMRELNGWTCIR